ncbi:MAG: hypothetical protein HYZ55_03640 [Nitrosarchaeum sp.]|nr:hypothetical protein [Nitrosarchaeum sp.]
MVYAVPTFSFKIGSLGTANEQLKSPNDVIVSSDGNTIYAVDTENHRINVFDDDGDHDFKFGSFCDMALVQNCNDNADGADNDGDGQFNNPISGMLDSFGHFFVVDSGNERIQRFDDGGGIVRVESIWLLVRIYRIHRLEILMETKQIIFHNKRT